MTPVVILGGGPAGVSLAWLLARRGFDVTLLERRGVVGGNAGSLDVGGMRVDFGSHRLHPACPPAILADIKRMLGPDLLDRPRHGRIRLRGRWVHFPLQPVDLALHLPPQFIVGTLRDIVASPWHNAPGDSFADVLEHGLGRTICRDFYFPYAEKIWGVAPQALDAEQAHRRVSAGSIGKMVRKMLSSVPGFKPPGAGRFYYPGHGYGAISEAYAVAARDAGAKILLNVDVRSLSCLPDGTVRVIARGAEGEQAFGAASAFSTIPVTALIHGIVPPAPDEVAAAAGALKYRAMVLVYLLLDTERFTEYDAHYFPGRDVAVTRISEPKNYGLATLPGRTVLCAELPCGLGDRTWSSSDPELANLVEGALASADLPVRARVIDVVVRRLAQAYPIYLRDYRPQFDRIDRWLDTLPGVVTFGRQGLFVHDNTHHTLAMAYALNECLDDRGNLDRGMWREYRSAFAAHVVED